MILCSFDLCIGGGNGRGAGGGVVGRMGHQIGYHNLPLCIKTPSQMDVAPWCYKWVGELDGYLRVGWGIEHLTVLITIWLVMITNWLVIITNHLNVIMVKAWSSKRLKKNQKKATQNIISCIRSGSLHQWPLLSILPLLSYILKDFVDAKTFI